MRTARSITSGENFGDFLTTAQFSIEGAYSKSGAVQIDYILLSPKLFDKVQAGGVIRKGIWPGVNPAKWQKLNTMNKPVEAASDHAAVWVDLDL